MPTVCYCCYCFSWFPFSQALFLLPPDSFLLSLLLSVPLSVLPYHLLSLIIFSWCLVLTPWQELNNRSQSRQKLGKKTKWSELRGIKHCRCPFRPAQCIKSFANPSSWFPGEYRGAAVCEVAPDLLSSCFCAALGSSRANVSAHPPEPCLTAATRLDVSRADCSTWLASFRPYCLSAC